MSEAQALVYRTEYGDYYLPVEHFTLEQAIEEMVDNMGWENDEAVEQYGGILVVGLHTHSMDGEEVYECPNYDEEVGDEPEPCIGYVNCHVFG